MVELQLKLVDSDVVIDWLRAREEATSLLKDFLERELPLCISVMTRIEVLAGARAVETRRTRKVLELFQLVNVDRRIADRAADLLRDYRRSHSGINIADYLIGATAIELDAELITRNIKHYPMFAALDPAY